MACTIGMNHALSHSRENNALTSKLSPGLNTHKQICLNDSLGILQDPDEEDAAHGHCKRQLGCIFIRNTTA